MAYEGCTAETLKVALAHIKWRQRDLAERLDVTEETVSRWVNGHLETPKYVWAYLNFAQMLYESAVEAVEALGRNSGRICPCCGHKKALTNAERQRAWRERKRGNA